MNPGHYKQSFKSLYLPYFISFQVFFSLQFSEVIAFCFPISQASLYLRVKIETKKNHM